MGKQVPLAPPVSVLVHASQVPLQAVLQHTPSMQWFVLHTAQPASLQLAPAVSTQAAPGASCAAQVPSLLQ